MRRCWSQAAIWTTGCRKGGGIIYDPIDVDRTIADGDTIRLGETELTAHAHSGHTPGLMSFSFSTQDGERSYNVLVANMNSINTGVKLLDSPGYPTIAEDFARTLSAQANMTPDIWVSSHARHFNLHDIYAPGDPYDPARLATSRRTARRLPDTSKPTTSNWRKNGRLPGKRRRWRARGFPSSDDGRAAPPRRSE